MMVFRLRPACRLPVILLAAIPVLRLRPVPGLHPMILWLRMHIILLCSPVPGLHSAILRLRTGKVLVPMVPALRRAVKVLRLTPVPVLHPAILRLRTGKVLVSTVPVLLRLRVVVYRRMHRYAAVELTSLRIPVKAPIISVIDDRYTPRNVCRAVVNNRAVMPIRMPVVATPSPVGENTHCNTCS